MRYFNTVPHFNKDIRASFLLVYLFFSGICKLCVLQNISADLRSVSPGENITLHCSVSADYEISWFHQNSEQQMKLLVSAARGQINKSFTRNYNVNEVHYELNENSSSVSLVIIGVNDTDLGLFYCGGRNTSSLLQFGKPIRLTFTGKCSEVIITFL
uniref:Ig-like domain-containing protein n=1 Tax=Astyanax mexicanus TaxID=7994 RepID=A0A3B1K2J3_ASTMX